jgi:hypothetical protein
LLADDHEAMVSGTGKLRHTPWEKGNVIDRRPGNNNMKTLTRAVRV